MVQQVWNRLLRGLAEKANIEHLEVLELLVERSLNHWYILKSKLLSPLQHGRWKTPCWAEDVFYLNIEFLCTHLLFCANFEVLAHSN